MNPSPGCSDEVIRLFLARELSYVPQEDRHQRTHEEAGLVVRHVPLTEAVDMVLSGEITNAACMIGLLTAARYKSYGWAGLRKVDEPLNR